jgi:hypothetical protein
MPVVGFVSNRSAEAAVRHAAAFRKGLNETGYFEGQNVMVQYHWLKGHVWTAPAMQGESDFQRSVRVQPCIRPFSAAVWLLALM